MVIPGSAPVNVFLNSVQLIFRVRNSSLFILTVNLDHSILLLTFHVQLPCRYGRFPHVLFDPICSEFFPEENIMKYTGCLPVYFTFPLIKLFPLM